MPPERPASTTTPADRYQALWSGPKSPDLTAFLATEPPLSTSMLADVLRVDQNERWRRGDAVAVEQYFERFPQIPDDAESALTLIYGEVLTRSDRGETPSLADFTQRFPLFTDLLALQWEVHHALNTAEVSETITAARPLISTAPGPLFSGFDVEAEVGRGAVGIVYRARQLPLNRPVALKVIVEGQLARPEKLYRFMEEARLVARLRHPHIVGIYDLGQHDAGPYMSLEWVGGGTLADWVAAGPAEPKAAADMMLLVCRAVGYAHSQGVVHRDLKPANILLTPEGEPKVADFGLAKDMDLGLDGATQTGFPLGTALYMGPEQALGKKTIGPSADVYSLGAILYELLTGRVPLRGATVRETLRLVEEREPVSPRAWAPSVPEDLATICLKCLEKKPADRYPNGDALADDLKRFLSGKPVVARPVGLVGRCVRWANRHREATSVAAGFLVLSLLLSGTTVWHWWRASASVVLVRTGVAAGGESAAIPPGDLVERTETFSATVLDGRVLLSENDRVVIELVPPHPAMSAKLTADGTVVVAETTGGRFAWNVAAVRAKLAARGVDW